MPRPSRPVLVAHGVSALLVLLLAGAWWSTAASTADARLSALQLVEPYALAVHEQLMVNFARTGQFAQTVHRGYDDAWTWSGHRALTLPLVAWLHCLSPTTSWLLRIQLLGVLLGVVPAALIGRSALRSGWGLLLGGAIYLSAPPVLALALQDYQDLVFAVPALTFALWAARSERWWLVVIGTMVAVLPREECIPLAVAAALVTIPPKGPKAAPEESDGSIAGQVSRWRSRRTRRARGWHWLRNVLLSAAIVGAYGWWLQLRHPVHGQGYDMPLTSALTGLFTQQDLIFLDGWPYLSDFYLLVFLPLGALALLSPLPLLPALALIFLHLTVPEGMGVDRSWAGHAHHLATAVPFVVVATIDGAARLLRLARRLPGRGGGSAAIALAVAMVVVATWQDGAWARRFNLVFAGHPAWNHPAWELAARIPAEAVPITTKGIAVVVATWPRSFTYDDSLDDKAAAEGLGAGDWLLADARQQDIVARGKAMAGAEVVAESGPFVLLHWPTDSVDRTWMRYRDKRMAKAPPYTGNYPRRTDIPGVPPFETRPPGSTVPHIRLPWR